MAHPDIQSQINKGHHGTQCGFSAHHCTGPLAAHSCTPVSGWHVQDSADRALGDDHSSIKRALSSLGGEITPATPSQQVCTAINRGQRQWRHGHKAAPPDTDGLTAPETVQASLRVSSRPGTAEDAALREPFVINLTDTRCCASAPSCSSTAACCTLEVTCFAVCCCRQFVNQPGPRNEPLHCRILRQRVGTLRAADQYILQV